MLIWQRGVIIVVVVVALLLRMGNSHHPARRCPVIAALKLLVCGIRWDTLAVIRNSPYVKRADVHKGNNYVPVEFI